MTRLIHRTVIGLLKRLPLTVARWAFRAYNKVLPWAVRECVATTYFGARMRCDPADFIQRTVLHFGVWEPDVSRTIERNLAAGDVFVDIGANVGYDTLLASSCVGSSGRVVAIEASPSTFALLQRNVSLNPFTSNVRAVNAAVSDRRGTTRLFEVEAANIGTATTLASRGRALLTEVDAFTLEDILSPDEMRRARLIKIDVEGAEPPILDHILSRLSSYPPTLDFVVEANPHDDVDAWRHVFHRLTLAGFSAWAIENDYTLDAYLRWRSVAPLRRMDAMPDHQQDLLFTRRRLVSALS